jgi:hypothetical protein
MMRWSSNNGNGGSPNERRYEELARQNREGHERVERSLREAQRLAESSRRPSRPKTRS